MSPGIGELFVLLMSVLLPLAAILVAIYLVVRLAIRHEHRDRPDR